MAEFPGASIAVLSKNERGTLGVVAIQRDDNPDIPYPGRWELPGGTLEPGEDHQTGAIRECLEEVGVQVDPEEIIGTDEHLVEDESNTLLVIAVVALEKILRMRLGDEGMGCELFELDAFLANDKVIPEHKLRLRRFLSSIGHAALIQPRPELAVAAK